MRYAYSGYDKSGKPVSGTTEASSSTVAGDSLRGQGIYATEIIETGGESPAATPGSGGGRAGGRSKRLRAMAGFVRQLSILVSTGTPIMDSITSLEQQIAPGHWRASLGDIRARIEQGASLSAALEHHPAYFDAVARSLIAAGESGGMLDAMLKRLSTLTRQQVRTRAMVAGAMVYPCLLITVALSVLGVMLFFVLPRFEGLFHSLGSGLPPTTQLLIDLSNGLRSYWWIVIPGVVGSVVGAVLWAGTNTGRDMTARFLVRAPQVGKLFRAFATARIARVLGVLVEGKVPLLEALALARESAGNPLYSKLMADAEERVTRGEAVSAALEGSPLIDPSIVEAIRSGERSGQLGPVLLSLSDFMDEDNEVVLKSLSSVVEPLILVVLGVLIGFVAISMFLPLFDLAGATDGAIPHGRRRADPGGWLMILRRDAHSPIGLDVGARTIKAVQLVHARHRSEIRAAAAFPRIAPGEELNPAEIIRAVSVLRRQGFVGNQTVVCIPSAKMLSAVIELPAKSSGAPLDAIARQELARSCKKEPGSIEIAWWELPAPASAPTGPGTRSAHGTQALALGCAHADADALLACFEPSGLDVIAIDARPAAVARACAALAADAPNLTAVLSLGYDAAHILILVGRTLVYERTLPEASLRLLASGVANQLSVSEELAEHVLRTIGCRPPEPGSNTASDDQAEIEALGAEARALVCAHADALAAELKTSLSYAARRFDGEIMRILLSGAGADIPGVGDRIAQRAGIPEGEARAARADALTPARPDVDPAQLGPGAALALGLALHGAPEADAHIRPALHALAPAVAPKEVAA